MGSPADAGIDPLYPAWAALYRGLPRRRGDRPTQSRRIGMRRQAPPQTRGSTRVIAEHRFDMHGSPADAGIDPACCSRPPAEAGLPRRRGDRPPRAAVRCRHRLAPPQTRGSTPGRQPDPHHRPGSPADAGIDPSSACCQRTFAETARRHIRLEGGGYRRDHLRALAQRVEVADGEVRIIGSKSRLLQVLTGKNSVNSVPTQGLKWRREWDSNPRYAFTYTRFPSVRLKPLGHPSASRAAGK